MNQIYKPWHIPLPQHQSTSMFISLFFNRIRKIQASRSCHFTTWATLAQWFTDIRAETFTIPKWEHHWRLQRIYLRKSLEIRGVIEFFIRRLSHCFLFSGQLPRPRSPLGNIRLVQQVSLIPNIGPLRKSSFIFILRSDITKDRGRSAIWGG